MRDFFKSELETLQMKTGLKQYEHISNMPDAEKQFKILLDGMVLACNEFPYIPDPDKKRIIQEQIIRDQDYTSLNSRVIWKWLNAQKDHYWQRFEDQRQEEKHEQCDPAIADMYAEQFKENLKKMEIKTQRQPIDERFGKSVSQEYLISSYEQVSQKELRLQWMRENFDINTGKPLQGSITFEEWQKRRESINENT